MKVKQLVKYLQRYPEDTDIFIKGYEGGVDSVNSISRINVNLYEHSEWYYGQHETTVPERSDCVGILLAYDPKLFCNTHIKYPKLSLLNAEGDIFRLYRLPSGKFIIEDQHRVMIGKYTYSQIREIIEGKTTLRDSNGDVYNYEYCDAGMKPDPAVLDAFINNHKIK